MLRWGPSYVAWHKDSAVSNSAPSARREIGQPFRATLRVIIYTPLCAPAPNVEYVPEVTGHYDQRRASRRAARPSAR